MQSKVLRSMFANLMGAGGSGSKARVGCKRKAGDQVGTPLDPCQDAGTPACWPQKEEACLFEYMAVTACRFS